MSLAAEPGAWPVPPAGERRARLLPPFCLTWAPAAACREDEPGILLWPNEFAGETTGPYPALSVRIDDPRNRI